ncbi:hypothetical protein [Synechocystis sp. PCC 7509]|uniref:hypothetical protein n=1 Tax=Synechocystis sp. PCC 7509 TaxID=927677 RepID=UPI0002AC21A0|nr:hypothetical protein [Synechocystis sp. PCC 7509]
MSSHFNVKSLSFYAIAIGSVLLLFNVVTAYGESKLKAPKTIGGRYQLTLANSLPGCPQIAPLMLQLDQSGTYVNAAILKKEVLNSMSAEEKLTLTGLFKEQQLSLTGNVANSVLCDRPQASGESAIALTSQIEGDDLVGTISVNGEAAKTPFTGKKAVLPNASPSSGH